MLRVLPPSLPTPVITLSNLVKLGAHVVRSSSYMVCYTFGLVLFMIFSLNCNYIIICVVMCLKSISPTRISVTENCSSPIFFITTFSAPGTLPGMWELSKVTYLARGKHVLCSWTACMARCASHRLLPVRHPRGTEECVALAFRSLESRWEWGREWPITLHCLKCQQMWIGWVLREHRGGGSDGGWGSKGSPSGDEEA